MNWKLVNSILELSDSQGQKFIPTAEDLILMARERSCSYDGQSYPSPFDELHIRISNFYKTPQIVFSFADEKINIDLQVNISGSMTKVGKVDNNFAGYALSNGTCYILDNVVNIINEYVSAHGVDIHNIPYSNYIEIIRDFEEKKIPCADKVEDQINEIKTNYTHFKADGLQGTLFAYQDCGCNWLSFMTENKCGCILGDEMGLGKTLQVITLFGSQKEKNPNSHFLVICPVSLLENWKREIYKFYPSLSVLKHHGARRTGVYKDLLDYDVIVTSYSNAQADRFMFDMINWDIIVLDEAQNIKNPYAKRTKAVKEINRKMAIAVTGTPFENHMTDIWSIVDFVIPGYLGKLSQFEMHFLDDTESAAELEHIISPIILRRRVMEVAKDLPERMDIPVPIIMTDEEAKYYEMGRKNYLNDDNLMSMALDKIQNLRMFCSHPLVYDPDITENDPIEISNKYERLCAILEEVFQNGEKAIIFTSFTKMIEIMVRDIHQRYGVYTNFINGTIPADERQKIIDEFSKIKQPGVLVLNPKAAGAGLNIVAANHVIHYNLEWNPAVEDQASARAWRRGQDKPVFVYRLYYVNTIEELINEKIQKKRAISDGAIVGNTGNQISKAELLKALSLSPYNS